MVIGPNGEQLGIKSTKDAITLSTYAGFDLVMINPNGNPPVCKVMDYNKYKYQNKKKQKENINRGYRQIQEWFNEYQTKHSSKKISMGIN